MFSGFDYDHLFKYFVITGLRHYLYQLYDNSLILFFFLPYLCGLKIKILATKFSKETYLYWYELMLLLRRFEEKAGQMYGMQKIRGFCHLYIGQEAIAAGCMTATNQTIFLLLLIGIMRLQ